MTEQRKVETRAYASELYLRKEDNDKTRAVIEGYACLTSTEAQPLPDSYNSIFAPGSFQKTIKERFKKKKKVHFFFDHDYSIPIGILTDLKEDSKGLWFKGEINLNTQRGNDVYELIKQGAIPGVSFGFKIVNDKINHNGLWVIEEVILVEISPVIQPAQDMTSLEVADLRSGDFDLDLRKYSENKNMTQIRNEEQEQEQEDNSPVKKNTDERGEYKDAVKDRELMTFNIRYTDALIDKLDDLVWELNPETTAEDAKQRAYDIINEFEGMYLEMLGNFIERFTQRSEAFEEGTEQRRFAEYLERNETDLDTLVRTTSLTEQDTQALRKGQAHFVAVSKLEDLDDELRSLIRDSIYRYSNELKQNFRNLSEADAKIVKSLESRSQPAPDPEQVQESGEDEERCENQEDHEQERIRKAIEEYLSSKK